MSKIAHPHVDLSAVASAVWNTGCSWNDGLQLSQKRDNMSPKALLEWLRVYFLFSVE